MGPNQSKSEQSSLELPGSSAEMPGADRGPASPELDYQIVRPPTSQPAAMTQVPMAPPTLGALDPKNLSQSSNQPTTSLQQTAADGDILEKEWILRAKHIFAGNRTKPHEQAKEFSLLKEAYLKKRFNKDIKIADG